MEVERKADNSTEARDLSPKADSSTDLVNQEKTCMRTMDGEAFEEKVGYEESKPSSESLPDGVTSCTKKDNMAQEGHADQGCNGTYSKLEDQSFLSSKEGSEALRPAPHLAYRVQPIGHGNGYQHMTKVSSFPSQQQNVFRRPSELRSRSFGQNVYNADRSRMNQNYIHQRNDKESDELIRGPRSYRMTNFSTPPSDQSCTDLLVRKEQYNKSDFCIEYEQARFFMIKSYSEDDVHKSIKYSVWASTPYGNNKLDAAFKNSQMLMKESGKRCPVFLFFSVNASGQFVGLAEMMGPVDFQKSMDFWQQDKWAGFFPVTWHVIKDIPNRQFQSIILENNDNRPVPFSRDTQEIGLPQGLRMLFIFKGFPHGASVLDDFQFYEEREKALRARRSNREASHPSGLEISDQSRSLNQLEAAFRNVSVSSEAAFRNMNASEGPRITPDHRRSLEAAFRSLNVSERPSNPPNHQRTLDPTFRNMNVTVRPWNPPNHRRSVVYDHSSTSSVNFRQHS